MRYVPLAVIALAILVGLVSCEVSIWQECRVDHSWLYCSRVLSH